MGGAVLDWPHNVTTNLGAKVELPEVETYVRASILALGDEGLISAINGVPNNLTRDLLQALNQPPARSPRKGQIPSIRASVKRLKGTSLRFVLACLAIHSSGSLAAGLDEVPGVEEPSKRVGPTQALFETLSGLISTLGPDETRLAILSLIVIPGDLNEEHSEWFEELGYAVLAWDPLLIDPWKDLVTSDIWTPPNTGVNPTPSPSNSFLDDVAETELAFEQALLAARAVSPRLETGRAVHPEDVAPIINAAEQFDRLSLRAIEELALEEPPRDLESIRVAASAAAVSADAIANSHETLVERLQAAIRASELSDDTQTSLSQLDPSNEADRAALVALAQLCEAVSCGVDAGIVDADRQFRTAMEAILDESEVGAISLAAVLGRLSLPDEQPPVQGEPNAPEASSEIEDFGDLCLDEPSTGGASDQPDQSSTTSPGTAGATDASDAVESQTVLEEVTAEATAVTDREAGDSLASEDPEAPVGVDDEPIAHPMAAKERPDPPSVAAPTASADAERLPSPSSDQLEDADSGSVSLQQALDRSRPGLAAHIARLDGATPLADSLELLALAEGARSATGECVAAFRARIFADATSPPVPGLASRFITAAAAARLSLLAPFAGPHVVLSTAGTEFSQHQALSAAFAAFGTAAQRGVQLPPELTDSVRDVATVEHRAEELRRRARDLLESAGVRTNKYMAATMIWKKWMHRDDLLGALLVVVVEDDRAKIQEVNDRVLDLRPRRALEKEIHRADARATARNKITGPARDTLLAWASEALEIAAGWVEAATALAATAGDGRQADWQAGALGELREDLGPLRSVVATEVDALANAQGEPSDAAAIRLAGRCLDRSLRLVIEGDPLKGGERQVSEALNRHLLLAPATLLLEGWTPERVPTAAELAIAAAASPDRPEAWTTAYEIRSGAGDFVGAYACLAALDAHDVQTGQLRSELDRAVTQWRPTILRLRSETEAALNRSRRLGYLEDDEWARLSGQFENPEVETRLDLGRAQTQLLAVRADLDAARDRAIAAFTDRLDGAASDVSINPKVLARIHERLEEGDLATADEYLALALDGEDIPATEPSTGKVLFEHFYPQPANKLAGRAFNGTTVRAIAQGGQWGDLDFGWLEPSDRAAASQAVANWLDLCESIGRAGDGALVQPILTLLGIEAARVVRAKGLPSNSRERAWLEAQGMRRIGRAMIPEFGSLGHSNGSRLLILLVKAGTSAQVISDWIKQEHAHRPVMVWYLGPISPRDRSEIAHAFRSAANRRPVLIIDSTLLVFLGASRGRDYETTMRLTLPFSAVNPYLPGVAGLVPVEMFYGRDTELREVMSSNGSSFVYGGRQLGKSALLFAAQRRFDNGSDQRAIYIDLKGQRIGVRNGLPTSAIWGVLWEELARLNVTSGPQPARDVERKLTQAVKDWLEEDDSRMILALLDECDPLLEADAEANFATVSQLKALMEDTRRRFKVVFAGLHRVQRYDRVENHPLAHLGRPIGVGPLNPRVASTLIAEPTGAMGLRFESEDLVFRILAICNNQPSLIVLFMKALIDRMLDRGLRTSEPPVMITDEDVESTYLSQDVAEQIKYRFDLTLGLDPAYKVVAYSFALAAQDRGAGGAFTETELKREAAEWWPAGIATMSSDGFRAVCDEMVGLGVLARGEDGYRLRSPNVLRLLGSREQISDTLLEMLDEPAQSVYDPAQHRPLFGEPSSPAPLSSAQLADLYSPANQVRIVVGAALGGVDSVGDALAALQRDGIAVTRRDASHSGATGAFAPSGAARHTVAVIDLGSVSLERGMAVLEQARAATAKGRAATLGVVLLAGLEQRALWQELALRGTPGIVELSRYSRSSLKAAATDLELVLDDATVGDLLSRTGGWFDLVNHALSVMKRASPEAMLAWVDDHLGDITNCRDLLSRAGLPLDSPLQRSFSMIGDLAADGADEDTLADVVLEAELASSTEDAIAQVEVLRALGALEPGSDGYLRPESVLLAASTKA